MTSFKKNISLSGELEKLLSSVDYMQPLKEGEPLFYAGDIVTEL